MIYYVTLTTKSGKEYKFPLETDETKAWIVANELKKMMDNIDKDTWYEIHRDLTTSEKVIRIRKSEIESIQVVREKKIIGKDSYGTPIYEK